VRRPPRFPQHIFNRRERALVFGLLARIWGNLRLAGILRFCEFGYTRFHEGERLDEGTGLAWV
jgi:hypothetical protein